jgi:uncharacterized protein
MDNKVVTTLARVFVESGAAAFRFNFRGVGSTEGVHDEGRGETDDMLRVVAHAREQFGALPLKLAGFSFGGAVAVRESGRVEFEQLVLVAPGLCRITGEGMGEAPKPDDPHLERPAATPPRTPSSCTAMLTRHRDYQYPGRDALSADTEAS